MDDEQPKTKTGKVTYNSEHLQIGVGNKEIPGLKKPYVYLDIKAANAAIAFDDTETVEAILRGICNAANQIFPSHTFSLEVFKKD